MSETCYRCEQPISMQAAAIIRHPIFGPYHASCGKTDKACPVCHMAPCECD